MDHAEPERFSVVQKELTMSLQTFVNGRVVLLSLSVIVITILSSTQITAGQAITAEYASQLQKRLLDAMVAADWKTTADMMSDNLIYIHPNGLVNTKQQRLEPLLKGPSPVWTRIESKDVHVQVFSDTAIVTSETIFTHVPERGSTQGQVLDLRFTTVWANEKGTWRLVLWHCTTIPPQKS
jgi:ketosteroid isomerase-like protein